MDTQIEQTLAALHSRHLNGIFAENSEKARLKILELMPRNAVVGVGDSTAINQLGIPKALKERGTKVLDGFEPGRAVMDFKAAEESHNRIVKEATICDVFLTGTNAVIQDGRLVNVDAVGNRVAGMFWGHPISVIVVGRNKIVRDLDEAFHRVRNIIAPNHVRIRSVELGGKRRQTPCVATGECDDCRSMDRICNIFTIIEGKPLHTDLNVVIVNEDLGLGWDPSWPQDRIAKILENYKRFVWIPPKDDG